MSGMTYAGVGVNYGTMDPFKRMAQEAGLETAANLARFGFSEVDWSRGESCYLIDIGDAYLGFVEEGLGTKNLVADSMYNRTNKSYYDCIAWDAVAMIVNDMITLGVFPLSVAMHLVVGWSGWFYHEDRCRDLVEGWKKACNFVRCAWGGGETSTLKSIVAPESVILSGSAMGIVRPKDRLISPGNIQHGDAIVFVGSSGIHANGLTMAQEIAVKLLPSGYLTQLGDGRTYGEALLQPTHIYVGFVDDCFNRGVKIHYAVNITGHGWRKLMRAKQPFTYFIERLPKQLPIFDFLQKHGPIDDSEAYGNLNMGVGFALYVSESDVDTVLEAATLLGFDALYAGHIQRSLRKQVIIKPKDLIYHEESLGVR